MAARICHPAGLPAIVLLCSLVVLSFAQQPTVVTNGQQFVQAVQDWASPSGGGAALFVLQGGLQPGQGISLADPVNFTSPVPGRRLSILRASRPSDDGGQ
jgi:hypothetical protein